MTTNEKKWPIVELERLLSPSLGQEKACEVVGESARALGVWSDQITQQQALAILERIASLSPGLIGITARFAKSQVVLRWN